MIVATSIEIHLDLPPPSANRMWRRAGHIIHKSTEYKKWLKDAGVIAKSQARGRRVDGSFRISAQLVRPDRRKRDLDNRIKPLLDLLVGVRIIEDDCFAEMISVRWVSAGAPVSLVIEPCTADGTLL